MKIVASALLILILVMFLSPLILYTLSKKTRVITIKTKIPKKIRLSIQKTRDI